MALSLCILFGFGTSVFSLIVIAVSIASSQWLRIRTPSFGNDVGLMRHCDLEPSMYCGDMDQLHDLVSSDYIAWFKSIQALYLLHCVGALISTALYILHTFRFFESKSSFKVITVFNFLTLACGIYSVAIFGTSYSKIFHLENLQDDGTAFGHGYFIAIAGCSMTFVLMIFSAMEASHAATLIQNMRSRITIWTTPYTLFVDQQEA